MLKADVTVTPGRRLAQALRTQHSDMQIRAGKTVWSTPVILPWSSWISAWLDEHVATGGESRLVLAPNQALRIWEDVVSADVAIGAAGVALMALRAWGVMHEWLLEPVDAWEQLDLSPDSERFAAWAIRYEAALAENGWMDRAMWQRDLPSLIESGRIDLPASITLNGFVGPMSAGQTAIVEALEQAGVSVRKKGLDRPLATPAIARSDDRDHELEQAAEWACRRLEAGDERIGIVVPDLGSRINEVERAMRRSIRPDLAVLDDGTPPHPWRIAASRSLIGVPVVAQALDCLRLNPAGMDKAAVSDLLRSPFVGGWRLEQFDRANLDLALRDLPGDKVSQGRLATLARPNEEQLPMLLGYLDEWARRVGKITGNEHLPSAWARQFSAELDALAYGSGRTLSHEEYHAWEAWQEVMDELAGMDAVAAALPRHRALALLESLVELRSIQSEDLGHPVEVMTMSDALGGRFDGLWVVGMDDSRWPEPAQPEPLLPRSQQQHCPTATADGQLERARAILHGLCQASDNVIFSYPAMDGDLPMSVSTLLSFFSPAQGALEDSVPAIAWPDQVELERVENEDQAPPITDTKVKGGTRVLYLQSACPFRAMAERRLNAVSPEEIRSGIGIRVRGSMLHDALEHLWRSVSDSGQLKAMSADERETLVEKSANKAVDAVSAQNRLALSDAMVALERERLKVRLLAWIDIELARPDFRVVGVETESTLKAGGLEFRIKLDRVDEDSNGRILIDYKTGKANPSSWYPHERIEDPQLPAYVVAGGSKVKALAFGRLRPDQLGYAGLSEVATDTRGITALARANRGLFRNIDDWDELRHAWTERVNALAADFKAGNAAVAPRDAQTCKNCPIKPFCRIRHKLELEAKSSAGD